MLAEVISYTWDIDDQVAKLITVTSLQHKPTTLYCPVHYGIIYKTVQQIFKIPLL